ncbi:hypothetical protein E2C01_018951 [Portunus trituberculatus]|uniref:Uncharacterized protein n=1 Tax=Portunus trituberculatus TaxID=210409 RepID=A0A5B7DWN0_PORTR|nr:hypothetical protein [Portunus trituberculatus]
MLPERSPCGTCLQYESGVFLKPVVSLSLSPLPACLAPPQLCSARRRRDDRDCLHSWERPLEAAWIHIWTVWMMAESYYAVKSGRQTVMGNYIQI